MANTWIHTNPHNQHINWKEKWPSEENFQLILYKGLVCLLYKDNLKMFKKTIYYFKIGHSKQTFHREYVHIVVTYEYFSSSLISRQREIKTLRYYFLPIQMSKNSKA